MRRIPLILSIILGGIAFVAGATVLIVVAYWLVAPLVMYVLS